MIRAIFGFKNGQLPVKHLGVPLRQGRLLKKDWTPILDKIEKKLEGWKEKHLSIEGRIVLINTVLTNSLMHLMSLIHMPRWITNTIDRIKRHFLWQGADRSMTKFHLVSWGQVCRSKEGGLGILDICNLDKSLLSKWWWKIIANLDGPVQKVLVAKYGPQGGTLRARSCNSQISLCYGRRLGMFEPLFWPSVAFATR